MPVFNVQILVRLTRFTDESRLVSQVIDRVIAKGDAVVALDPQGAAAIVGRTVDKSYDDTTLSIAMVRVQKVAD